MLIDLDTSEEEVFQTSAIAYSLGDESASLPDNNDTNTKTKLEVNNNDITEDKANNSNDNTASNGSEGNDRYYLNNFYLILDTVVQRDPIVTQKLFRREETDIFRRFRLLPLPCQRLLVRLYYRKVTSNFNKFQSNCFRDLGLKWIH